MPLKQRLLSAVRRAALLPGVRRLTTVTPVIRVTAALRGVLVREPARFARNELRRRAVTAAYTLRDGGLVVLVRHHSSDTIILDEIFSVGDYAFPEPAAAVLANVPQPLRVMDLGGNAGYFGAWMLSRHPDAEVVAYEPDPDNAAIHRRAIDANPDFRWQLVEAYATAADGVVRFSSGHGAISRIATDGDRDATIEVRAEDVLPELAKFDLIKMDIEGGEWPILEDARLRTAGAPVMVVEHHPEGCPGDDPGAEAERLLRAAGYTVLRNQNKAGLPGMGVAWAWRNPPFSTA